MPKNIPPRKDQNRVPRAPRNLAPVEPKEAERIAKVIARAGLGSRREIEEFIAAGRVAVNGEVLDTPARTVTAQDVITVDGEPLPAKERTRLFLYHKPRGVVTTNYDPEGRPTLFEILPSALPRLVSVGRLDLNTEGLILLTNDGGLSRVLELPDTGWLRRYRVRAKGEITQDVLDRLIDGITVEGVQYGPIEAKLDRVQGANCWMTLALREGKNREVRNVLGSLGLEVNRLIRLSYGPFQLGEIEPGAIEEVRTRVLADQLGPELSAAAGADFEGPMFDHGAAEAAEEAARAKTRYGKPEGTGERPRRKAIDTEPAPEKTVTAGLVADRKGRKVLVQRVRSNAPEPEPEEAPARRYAGRSATRPRREDDERRGPRKPGFGKDRTSDRSSDRPARDAAGEGGERTFRARPARRDSAGEGERSFTPRTERPRREEGESGERPFRARTERPARSDAGGERPFRSTRGPRRDEAGEGERGFRPRTERPRREESESGELSFRSDRGPRRDEAGGGERGFRPRGDRPPRREEGEGSRPARSERPARSGYRGESSNRPYSGRVKSEEGRSRGGGFRRREDEGGERPARSREEGGRSEGRSFGDKPSSGGRFGEKRSYGDRPSGDRSFGKPGFKGEREGGEGERPRGKSFGGKSFGGKSFGDKPAGGKPFGNKSVGDKPGGRPSGGKPSGGKSFGGKSSGGKSFGGKPGGRPGGGGKPTGRPAGGKPGGRPSGGSRG